MSPLPDVWRLLPTRTQQTDEVMIDIGRGIISGLVAAAVTAGAAYLCAMLGLVPEFDPVRAVGGIAIWPLGLGWVLHFALGAFVWGTLFAVLSAVLPGPVWAKGILFGAVAWALALAAAWLVEPGSANLISGVSAALHLLFGAALSGAYAVLAGTDERHRLS